MPVHESLKDLFTDIANTIRSKTGDTNPIVADDFPATINDMLKISDAYNLFNSGVRLDSLNVLVASLADDVEDFSEMFRDCEDLEYVPDFNTSHGLDFSSMFRGCTSLISTPQLDLNSATILSNMFTGCEALTTLRLYNIRQNLAIGSTNYGQLLTVESLVHTIQELCTVTESKKLTIGNANITKIQNLYCRIVDATHEKKTMELCEYTDVGAITLIQYAAEKGWQIL